MTTPDYAFDIITTRQARAEREAAALRLGRILQDPDAPAPVVNAAISAWRIAAGYEDACTCSTQDAAGIGAGGVCRSCREELASDEIPFRV